MSTEIKLCVNCKWCYRLSIFGVVSDYLCKSPQIVREKNPVTGEMQPYAKYCENLRKDGGNNYCGPDARFFETKESTSTIPESALVETDKAHQFDVPTEAEIDEMARLDKLKRRPIGTPHEL